MFHALQAANRNFGQRFATCAPIVGTVLAPLCAVAQASLDLETFRAFPANRACARASNTFVRHTNLDKFCVLDKQALMLSNNDDHNHTIVHPLRRVFCVPTVADDYVASPASGCSRVGFWQGIGNAAGVSPPRDPGASPHFAATAPAPVTLRGAGKPTPENAASGEHRGT